MAKLKPKKGDAKSQGTAIQTAEPTLPGSRNFIVICALWILVFLVFFPALRNGFLFYDDYTYVTGNVHVQQGLTLTGIKWAFLTHWAANWHPLTWLSHMLDVQLFGMHPWGHHLSSLLLHAINTSLVFLLLRKMTGALWRSLFVAALFAVHPLHVESVAWVAERKDVLSTTFWMLSLLAYARYARHDQGQPQGTMRLPRSARISFYLSPFYWLALFFFACGLLSKPMLVTAPFLMLLLDYWPFGRMTGETWRVTGDGNTHSASVARHSSLVTFGILILEKIPFLALAAAESAITVAAQASGNALAGTATVPTSVRVANALTSYAGYLGKIFSPIHLAVIYPYTGHPAAPSVLLAALIVAAISAVAFVQRHTRPYLFMGWAWFLGTLVPVIGLVQMGSQAMADRYTYVPAIGIFIAATWGVTDLTSHFRHKTILLAGVASAVLIACAAVSFRQIGYWKNNQTLFDHAIAVTTNNALAYSNLADYELNEGHVQQATELYREAVKLQPEQPLLHDSFGAALCMQGQTAEGLRELELAIRSNPSLSRPHADLARALLQTGHPADAVAELQEAIQLSPDSAGLRSVLGVALARDGRTNEAIAQFEQVIKSFPNDVNAHIDFGSTLEHFDRPEEAIAQYRSAVTLAPDNAPAHFDLAEALENLGRNDEAIKEFEEGLKWRPDSPEVHNELGILLGDKLRLNEAIRHFQEALQLKPDYAAAQTNLNLALKLKNSPTSQREPPR